MSQIITLGEHHFTLPSAPKSQDQVLFVKNKRDDQYWRRDNDFPQIFYDWNHYTKVNADRTAYNTNDGSLSSLSREDTVLLRNLRERELSRRVNGIWMMNDGDLTYMTGAHYFQLQWCRMMGYVNPYDGSKYGEYREFQRDFQYMYKLAELDKECGGFFCGKGKKSGITQVVASNYLEESTRLREKRFGMMSKSKEDCQRTGFAYYIFGLDGLPMIFRPKESNRNQSGIKFGDPQTRSTGSKASLLRNMKKDKEFNTEVFVSATKADGFDGPVMEKAWWDEWIKCEDPYPDELFKKMSESVKLQKEINGKVVATSYASETDGKNFTEAKKLWANAKLRTRNAVTGRTNNEMYTYFIPADQSAEGRIDKFGRCERTGAKHFLISKRDQVKDDRDALQAMTRQYPMTEEEMWREGGGTGSTFDNLRLGVKSDALEKRLVAGDLPYLEGRYEWEGVRLKSRAIFIPLRDDEKMAGKVGLFRIYHEQLLDPESFNVPFISNLKDDEGLYKPSLSSAYAGAIDPTEYSLKRHVAIGSKFAGTIMNFPNAEVNTRNGKYSTGRLVCRYLHRHDNPLNSYEDLVKMMWYFGSHMIVEANKSWFTTKMIEDGLENFLLVYDSERRIVPYKKYEHHTLISTQRAAGSGKDVIDEYCRAISAYLEKPGVDMPDPMGMFDDEELISQLMTFDPMDTKRFDLAVCFGFNLMAINSFSAYLRRLGDNEDPNDIDYMAAVAGQLL